MECGTLIEGGSTGGRADPTESEKQPVAERRVTSVLFGDLVGFTTLSESRDSEDVRELLVALLRPVPRQSSADTAERSRSSSATPSWPSGACPTAHEDDAERAVRAGLEIVESIAAMGADLQAPDLAMRVGRGHRRSGRHDRGHEPGNGRRGRGQHSSPGPVRGDARAGMGGRDHPIAELGGDLVH